MDVLQNNDKYMRMAWCWLAILTILRLFYSSSFLLIPDETNYWQWSRHLAWGYHDQAPMIAWMIRLTTCIFGQNELAVRLPSIIAITFASVYLILMARHWFNSWIAWQTALISQSILIFNVGGLLATADGLQGAAWVAAAYHSARSLESGQWRHWLISGIWFGIGLLSKFTVFLYLPCILAYVICTSRHRKYLLSIKPYVAFGMGGLMFLPVVLWNAGNNWNSVRHVAYIGGVNEHISLHFKYLIEFIGSQAGLLTPLVFLLIVAGWLQIMRRKYFTEQWIFTFLLWTSFPVVAGFTIMNLHSRVYANWPCFAYLTSFVLISAIWSKGTRRKKREDGKEVYYISCKWRWTLITSYTLTLLVLLQVLMPIIPIPAKLDRFADETQGWDLLGEYVGRIHQAMDEPEQTFIFGLNYQMASELAFYVPGHPQTVSINRWNRPNVYDYWWRDEDLLGRNAVGCLKYSRDLPKLQEVFDRVELGGAFHVYRKQLFYDQQQNSVPYKTFHVYRCYGFKGGVNWVPAQRYDIRR